MTKQYIQFACTVGTWDQDGRVAAQKLAPDDAGEYNLRLCVCLHYLEVDLRFENTKLLTVGLNDWKPMFII